MLRAVFSRAVAPKRAFSTTSRVMASGDTGSGASRAGGAAAGDAFTRREAASEDMWVKAEEKQKLLALKDKLAKQKEHIDKLSKDIDEIMKSSGGEHN